MSPQTPCAEVLKVGFAELMSEGFDLINGFIIDGLII